LKGNPLLARKPADQSVNREDIIIAAADALHRNGYEATTMKDIAAEVNLTAASLYHHFRNKDALLLAVLEEGLNHVIGLIEPVIDAQKSNAEKLAEMIRLHVVNVTRNTTVGAAMVFEIRSLMNSKAPRNGDKPTNMVYEDFMQRRDNFFARRDYFEKLFREVVKSGIRDGEFREVDAAIYAKTMLGAHNWVAVWYKESGRLSGEVVADMMADTFLAGLKP
jgi:AcrR family transcriptional regulator